MEIFSQVTGTISQSGRRGALMISIDVNHPDIEEFINCKTDLNKVNYANISVRVNNDFMEAVENNDDYILHWPCEMSISKQEVNALEYNKLTHIETISGPVYLKKVKAKELFNKLVKNNWDYAEPGILFWDRITYDNMLNNNSNFKFSGVNPCFGSNVKLLTNEGYKSFEDLCDTTPLIINVDGNISKGKVFCNGIKETVKIKTAKSEIVCTPNHVFMLKDGTTAKAKDLKGKYLMAFCNSNPKYNNTYVKFGFIQGDGQLNRLNSPKHRGLEVNIGKKDIDIFAIFESDTYNFGKDKRHIYLVGYNDKLRELGFSKENLPNRIFPTTYQQWSFIDKASFLRGCYSANGSVINRSRVAYKTTCKEFAEQLTDTLKKDFGLKHVHITTNKAHSVKFSNGEYVCKESYDVNIYNIQDLTTFASLIGFVQKYKVDKLNEMIKSRGVYVSNVIPNGKQKVYDFTEPKTHYGVVNGCIAHNCAELPLPAYGACLLGSINLSEFVLYPFTKNACVDWDCLEETTRLAVRALNQVLIEGATLHPLEQQQKSCLGWRQIGLGTMGLADMLIKLGIKYDSDNALNILDDVYKQIAVDAVLESLDMAKEFDCYPYCQKEKLVDSTFIKMLDLPKDVLKDIKKYGLYNSQLLTCAPTGSIGTMFGCSTGVEPQFALKYTRKTQSLEGKDTYFQVNAKIVDDYIAATGNEDLPDYFVTSRDIKPLNRVYVQSMIQKWIDNSISSTVNLPKEATVEQVADIYMTAWKYNLKGITIYRSGCKREGILVTEKPIEIPVTKAPKRPKDLPADFYTIISKGKQYIVLVGLFNGKPYEIFAYESNVKVNIPPHKGVITKKSKMNYTFISEHIQINKLQLANDNVEEKAATLYASMLLRHGVDIKYIVKTARKVNDNIASFTSAMCRILLKYMPPETTNEKCPECGGELIREGGCIHCKSCGYSRCE